MDDVVDLIMFRNDIVFNVQWKNDISANARSNMVGLVGCTTPDYHTFKSYLLNNSGAYVKNINNVRVSYIDGGNEYYIENDVDYCFALCYFREKASAGQYIDLKLDYVSCPTRDKDALAPEWFLKYMKKFKEEIVEEITAVIASKQHQCSSHPTRKLKAESYKRSRKIPLLIGDANDRELSTADKVQRKIETKLEKLEHKSTKIKTKKALVGLSSDSDAGKSSKSETNQPLSADKETLMSAALIATPDKNSHFTFLSGGETYVHSWEVINDGRLQWNSLTKLKYAWGSQALEPWEKDISCPLLKPGETGCINVTFNVPVLPGTYECYWHFYNNGKRFGRSLSTVVVVRDNPVKAENYIRGPTYDVINIQDNYELVLPTTWTIPLQKQETPICPTRGKKILIQKDTVDKKEDRSNDIDKIFNFVKGEVKVPEEADCGNHFLMAKNENVENLQCLDGNDVMLNDTNEKIEVENSVKLLTQVNPEVNEKNITADFDFLDECDDQSIISISDSNASTTTKSGDEFVLLQDGPNSPKAKDGMSQSFWKDMDEITDTTEEDAKTNRLVNKLTSGKKDCNIEKHDEKLIKENENMITINTASSENIIEQVSHEVGTEAAESVGGGDTADLLKTIKAPIEFCEPGIATTAECAYIFYEGRKIPVPKHYLREDYLRTAEKVPKEVIPNMDDSFLYMEIKSGLKQANEENDAIPKSVEAVNNEKPPTEIKSKSSSPSTCTQKKEKTKSEKLQKKLTSKADSSENEKIMKKKEEKGVSEKSINPVCSSTISSNERQSNPDLIDNQRFFVFPQQSPGYEIVSDLPKAYSVYDSDPEGAAVEDEPGFIKIFVLYEPKIRGPEWHNFFAYIMPLNHIEPYLPELEDAIDKHELLHYAFAVDYNSVVNCALENPDGTDNRYILLPLREGVNCSDCTYHAVQNECVFTSHSLLNHLWWHSDFHRKKGYIVSLNTYDYCIYEIKTVTRWVANTMNIRPQTIIPQYNLKLYTTALSFRKDPFKLGPKRLKVLKTSIGTMSLEESIKYQKMISYQLKKRILEKDETHSPPKATTSGTAVGSSGNVSRKPLSPPKAASGTAVGSSGNVSSKPLSLPKAKTDAVLDEKKKLKKLKSSSLDSDMTSPDFQPGSSNDSESSKGEFFHLLRGKMDGLKKTVIGTAKEVIDIVTPPSRSSGGYWCQGRWISTNPNSKRERALQSLNEMGFKNRDLNATLLARFDDDITVALNQLLDYNSDV